MDYEAQSYLSVVYGSSQATLATVLVLIIGYIASGTRIFGGAETSVALRRIASTLLLPALVISVVGSETSLDSILSYWPILAFTAISHALSLFVSYLFFYRLFGLPAWIIPTLSFNNLTSFPLLILAGLAQTPGVLNHLFQVEIDLTSELVRRGSNYILLNAFVSEILRISLTPLLPKTTQPLYLPLASDEADDESPHPSTPPTTDVETAPDERSPLLSPSSEGLPSIVKAHPASSSSSPAKRGGFWSYFNPLIVSTVVALLLALIPGVQSAVFGSNGGAEAAEGGERVRGLIGGTLGTTVGWLGGGFAVLELLGGGGGLRFRDAYGKDVKTLGVVLSIIFWRFAALPALISTLLWGARHLSPRFFSDDPVLGFILILVTLTPPLLPATSSLFLTTHQTVSLLQTYLLAPFLLAFPLAAGIAVAGKGVLFESKIDWVKALKSAAGGGVAGALAMIIQVLTLMPLRTIMNYQYRFGGSLKSAFLFLKSDGGFPRYYAGLGAALFQGPLSRFGDTAANAGIIALLESVDLPVLVKTIGASAASACFRMTLTPIDALKTTQQTQGGVAGLRLLRARVADQGVASLWYGAIATAAATFVGHYPWFATYNWLSEVLPPPHSVIQKLGRQALIGFSASVVSDTSSNSLRVLKTYRQVHEGDISYVAAAKEIIARDGVLGLFGRGLSTRILTNGLQGLLFSILWKLIADAIAGKQ